MQHERNQIDTKIQHITHALSQTADDNPIMPLLLASLGNAHNDRFDLLGEPNDIDKAIEYTHITLILTPDDDPRLPSLLEDLGALHGKRFRRLGEMDDNDQAIEYASLALASTPDGHPSLPNQLGDLGMFHHGRFERLGDLGDLEQAIGYETRALTLTPNGHPLLARLFANLGVFHTTRFERLGELGDLEKMIKYEARALALTSDGHPRLSSRLANLGVSLKIRFERLGELEDLEKAIEYQYRALTSTPNGHPHLASRLANLGVAHTTRFERLGELEDLEKTIEYETRALALTPDGHPDLASLFFNLGGSHTIRFQHLRELEDVDKAIKYQSRALAMTPDGHPRLASLFANLGAAHCHRSTHVGELEDINKAIKYGTQAVALTPDGHPQLPTWLYNLGSYHSHRFARLGHQDDLEKTIQCSSRVVELIPDGHPNFPHGHYSLAVKRLEKYQLTGDTSYLQYSVHSFRMAAQSLAGSPRVKFKYAIGWAEAATIESSLNCIEAYQTAIDLLPQFIWLGATTAQRYQDLISAESLAVDAALVTILVSDYGLALEWLEHTRCVVWNQNLMLRSPLDELHHHNQDLATRLQTVAAQLHYAGSESRESQALASGSLSAEQVAQRHRQLAQEHTNLISQARNLSGFEDFLRPMKANGLMRAARSGPIVVITCHESRCDALVVMPGQDQVSHIPLPNFTEARARMSRQEMGQLMRNSLQRERGVERLAVLEEGYRLEFQNVLSSLWYDVVKPVLDRLGYTNKVGGESLPHITWCPTGALSFLPLHAAGDYNQSHSRIYDYVISSYTPTLTALLSSTPSSLTPNSRVLAIGQPHTPGHSRLPGTVQELAHLQGHISGRADYSQLIGDQATTKAVLDTMEQHDWVHLACHAHQHVGDPTKSGFFLHDGALDLASINQRSFKGKGLAYLSACQTATGDEKLPDEAIHLASGMLMAGYSSVIATMWSVMDDDAPFVADKVYSQLMKDGSVGSGEAGRALHYAVAALREEVGERAFGRWVPYIHIGS